MFEVLKKKWVIIVSVLLAVIIFFSFAYVSGIKVLESPPQVQWVSHTEYWSGDSASTIIRLTDYKGDPLTSASCLVNIYNPDGSAFVTNGAMQTSSIPGNWQRKDSLAGKAMGTYEQEVTCTYGGGKQIKTSQSFHLNPALENIREITTNLSLSRNELSNINVSISGLVESTGQAVNLNIDTSRTNLTNLMKSIETGLLNNISGFQGDLNIRLTNINASLTANIADTRAVITTQLTNINSSITNLITNTLQPAIEAKIEQQVAALTTLLNNVNASVTGTVLSTGESINLNIDTTRTTLSDLLNTVESDVMNNIDTTRANLGTQLSNVNISLTSNLANTENRVTAQLTNINGSISNLITNTLQPAIEAKIEQQVALLMAQLSSVNASITGTVLSTGESINLNVDTTRTSITNTLNNVQTNVLDSITSTQANLGTQLSNVNVSLTSSIANTQNVLSTQLTSVNTNLGGLITNTLQPALESLMNQHYNNLSSAVANVYADTQWLVNNAMNQDNMGEITTRFNSVDSDLALIKQFCSNPQTDNSALCTELDSINTAIGTLRTEQNTRLDEISSITTNTWVLLSGSIATNINTILEDLNLIKSTTSEINATVSSIKDTAEARVDARIIS